MATESTTATGLDATIQFFLTAGECKATLRQGWLEHGIRAPESVAAHMHRMALMCLMCPDPALDKSRMAAMALCHDVAEAIVGDVSPRMNVPKPLKEAEERAAMTSMAALVPAEGGALHALWEEFEAGQTPEAAFVKDMDALDMVVQAYRYETTDGKDLSTFFGCVAKLKHPWAREIGERLLQLRQRQRDEGAAAVEPLPKKLLGAQP